MANSFVQVSPDSHFSLQNLPYGIFHPRDAAADQPSPRPGVAIGDYVLDLSAIASAGLFDGPILKSSSECFLQVSSLYCCSLTCMLYNFFFYFWQTTLNAFLQLGRPAWKEARATIQKLLSGTSFDFLFIPSFIELQI